MSVAAHDLRGPLAGIQASAQVLLRLLARTGKVEGDDARNLLEGIDRQTHRMSRMLTQLVDASRIESGQLRLAREAVGLTALARGVVDRVQAQAERHTFSVEAPGSVIARVDPARLEDVLSNLVDNAIRYSPEGGEVILTVHETGDRAVMTVRDHGVGLDVADRPRLFERFFRGNTAGPHEGVGLGLYISHEIIGLHGGKLSAEFPADGGACFVISLPIG
jgi:signal transduction histidine kinase